ncbi:MAG: DAK2 domain-containing protein [bacterium]|nr:DAK2 domain-containing protein [bacterium]
MSEIITTPQMLKALESMCDTIENEKEYLSELDGAIGDGDHGVNMAKCFREVKKKLAESTAEDIGTLFKDVGMVVMNYNTGHHHLAAGPCPAHIKVAEADAESGAA